MEAKESEVKLDDIVLGKDGGLENFREKTGLDQISLKNLADSIAESGLIERLKLWKDSESKQAKLTVLDGERRYRAMKMLQGAKKWNGQPVPVTVFECTHAEALALALENYAQRSDVSTYELAAGIERMQEAYGGKLSVEEIAKRVKKSKPWVSRNYGAYQRACPELREAWRTGKIPAETAMNLSEKPKDEQPALVEQQLKDRAGGSKVAAGKARNKAKAVAGKKKREYDTGNRPSVNDIRSELSAFSGIKKIDDPYARGVVDALKYVNGGLDYVDLGSTYFKLREKLIKAQDSE